MFMQIVLFGNTGGGWVAPSNNMGDSISSVLSYSSKVIKNILKLTKQLKFWLKLLWAAIKVSLNTCAFSVHMFKL